MSDFNLIQILEQYGLKFAHPGEHSHCTEGWANIECPFCSGNPGKHLGFHYGKQFFSCWRCGRHTKIEVIVALLGVSKTQAINIVKQSNSNFYVPKKFQVEHKTPENLKFPKLLAQGGRPHLNYLKKRGYNFREIEHIWKIKYTGSNGFLDNRNYSWRIIAPFLWDNRFVSYQGRDITDRQKLRYKACPKSIELMPHQNVLYGNQNYWNSKIGIVVEGITDCWKMGPESVAVSGIKVSQQQILHIAKIWDKIVIVFDPDEKKAAYNSAINLRAELRFRGVETKIYNDLKTDPGGMARRYAKQLTKHLLSKRFWNG